VTTTRRPEVDDAVVAASLKRRIAFRAALLLLTGVSIYLLAPSLLEIFSSWPQLRRVEPLWMALAVFFEAMSSVAYWALQRIAFQTQSWFAVGTSQLAGSAAGKVVPGGGAAASALQYRILVQAGIPPGRVASGVAASWAATTAAALALPVLALVAAIPGAAVPKGLRNVGYFGGGAFLVLALIGVLSFVSDRPLRLVGRTVRAVAGLLGKRARFEGLSERLLRERDAIRRTFSAHPLLALLAAVGKWGFDYLALLSVLAALSVHPDPALVLLAFASASLLGMIPITPGGLGFVEAGLAGLLVLAGVGGGDAAVATLAYRLVSFWLPLPVGAVAWWLARRRYGPADSPASAATTAASS
jgi:putative heme transporter